jgi:hypothetical protein
MMSDTSITVIYHAMSLTVLYNKIAIVSRYILYMIALCLLCVLYMITFHVAEGPRGYDHMVVGFTITYHH